MNSLKMFFKNHWSTLAVAAVALILSLAAMNEPVTYTHLRAHETSV